MATGQPPKYSIVVPCFNEAGNIVPLVKEILAACTPNLDFELIVVDDCSTDASRECLLRAREELSLPLRLIVHSRNFGQSAAICSGVDGARGEWIVTLDGDGQNDPRDIAKLVACLEQQRLDDARPIICGIRRRRRDTRLKRISSRIANGVRQALLKDATPDTGCGLKIVNRETFMRLPRFNHMHRFLPALVQRSGGAVVAVEVSHRPRLHGRSKYGINNRLWVGIVDLFGVMWLQRRAIDTFSGEEV
jgi:dolichol-phosphate mannosyltransferase